MAENFAFLKKPDQTWAVGLGHASWSANRPTGRPSFYAPDFFLSDPKPWLSFERMEIWSNEQWLSRAIATKPARIPFQPPKLENFLRRIEALLQMIHTGDLSKAVPVEFEISNDAAVDWRALLSALPMDSALMPYGFWTETETMVGVSPEVLLQVEGCDLQTMALAGTAALSRPSLLENPKEIEEHRLVIQDIVERLSSLGVVTIGTTAERLLPTLKHLHTPICLRLERPMRPETLIQRLHPTAALGGFPRAAAWNWLRQQPEASVRRRFGAPFAYVDDHSAFAVVAIRNLQGHSGKLWLGAGCGVVRGSVPEREWDELTLKRNSVRHSLGLPL